MHSPNFDKNCMREFSTFLNQLIGRLGNGRLADEIGVDGAALSRFRSGQGSLPLSAIDKILDLGEGTIATKKEIEDMKRTILTVTKFWECEMKSNLKQDPSS